MTIAALLATSLVFKLLHWDDAAGQATALSVGAIVCISAAIAGDTSQDLKTGYLVGATPWRQQAGELLGVLTSAAVVGWVVLRLHEGYGIGSEALPAPQATLMSLVVKGVLSGDLPWTLVFIGVAAAAVVEIIGIPSLPFAVGLYLPLSLTTPILLGGGVRWIIDRRSGGKNHEGGDQPDDSVAGSEDAGDPDRSLVGQGGVLFASGLIAGAAFLGMALGLMRSFGAKNVLRRFAECIQVGPEWSGSWQDILSALVLVLAAALLFYIGSGKLKHPTRADD